MEESLLADELAPPRGGAPATAGAAVHSPAADASSTRAEPRQSSRTGSWACTALLAGILVLAGQPLGVAPTMLLLSAMLAVVVAPPSGPGRLSVTAMLPAGFVLMCFTSLALGLACGLVDLRVWSDRGASAVGLVLIILGAGLVARRRGGSIVLVGRDLPALVAFVGLMSFFTWVVATQPIHLWSRINGAGTDFLRHLGFVRLVRERGLIEPGAQGYPEALHSTLAWASAALGVSDDADSLWRATAPVSFLMLGLILIGVVAVAARVTTLLTGSWPAGGLAGCVGAVVFVQTAWFSTFLALGNVMNMVVATCLMALVLSGLGAGSHGTPVGALVCASALAVTANAWPLLLPVVGLAAAPWIAASVRAGRRRWADWIAWGLGLAVSASGLVVVKGFVASNLVSVVTLSNLFRPDWWWGVALMLGIAVVVGASRAGQVAWAMSSLGAIVGCVGVTAYLLRSTGSSWDLMLYYPVKALWTAIVVLIPLAAAGGVTLAVLAWRSVRTSGPTAGRVVRGAIVLGAWIIVAGVAGRGSAFPPHLVTIASGESGLPNWSLALIDAMTDVRVDEEAREGVVVFGLVPGAAVPDITSGFVGMIDYMAMEALDHLGMRGASDSPVKVGLKERDMAQVCRYLKDHPSSLRITGPNPEAGPQWIIDSGCPVTVVQPQRWVRLDIDDAWFERSPWEGRDWSFPSVAEVRSGG